MIGKINRCGLLAGLFGVALVLLLAPGARAENPHLSKAIQAYENFEYDTALQLLKQAVAYPGSSKQERAKVHVYLGLVRYTLGDRPKAEQEFSNALRLHYKVTLPPDTSPKIVDCFDEVKASVPAPEPVKPPGGAGGGTGGGTGIVSPPPPPPPTPSGRVWTWVAAGVGAAALIGGGTFGYLASEAKSDFDNEPWADKAAELKDTIESRSLTANILFGVGGAAMVAAVVLFFTEPGAGNPPEDQKDPFSFSATPFGVEASFRF